MTPGEVGGMAGGARAPRLPRPRAATAPGLRRARIQGRGASAQDLKIL